MWDWTTGFNRTYHFGCISPYKFSLFQLQSFEKDAILFKENVLGGILLDAGVLPYLVLTL